MPFHEQKIFLFPVACSKNERSSRISLVGLFFNVPIKPTMIDAFTRRCRFLDLEDSDDRRENDTLDVPYTRRVCQVAGRRGR